MIYNISPFSVAYNWHDYHSQRVGVHVGLNTTTNRGDLLWQDVMDTTGLIEVSGGSTSPGALLEGDEERHIIGSSITPITDAPITISVTRNENGHRRRCRSSASELLGNCYFQGRFSPLTSQNIVDLNQAYQVFGGILPSRRELREVSRMIRVPQSEIKRWFLAQSRRSRSRSLAPAAETTHQDKSKDRLVELQLQIDIIEQRVVQLENGVQKNNAMLQKCLETLDNCLW